MARIFLHIGDPVSNARKKLEEISEADLEYNAFLRTADGMFLKSIAGQYSDTQTRFHDCASNSDCVSLPFSCPRT